MSFVRRHQIASFFVLAYILTWAAIPWKSFFAPGALLAAVIVVALTEGVAGLRTLGTRLIRWRVGWIWYAIAVAVPLLVHAVAISANLALGAAAPPTDPISPWYGIPLVIGINMINPTGGPFSEEPSFRGFAQHGLQNGRSRLAATTITAILIAGWHAPLIVMASFGLHPIDALATVAVTFWYAWLFNRAGGSALITLIAHATEGGIHPSHPWSTGADASRQVWLYALVWCSLAVGLLVFDRRFWAGRAVPDAGDDILPPSADLASRARHPAPTQ